MQTKTITPEQLDTFLTSSGLNYDVQMINAVNPFTNQPEPKVFCSYRTDTNEIFKYGLSQGFKPIQNRDAFGVIAEMSGVTNLDLVRGGNFRNGAGVFTQISLGEMTVGNNNDRVGKYLSIINSHDGSKGLNILLTPYRFVCQNSIAAAVRHAKQEQKKGKDISISIRHTAGATRRMEELIETIKIVNGEFDRTQQVYTALANTKVNTEHVKEVFERVFPLNKEAGKRGRTIWDNTIAHAWARFQKADGGIAERDTAWNLYNAVQGTIQHDSKNTSSKTQSIIMGSIAKRSAEALALVMDTTSSEHVPQSVLDEITALVGA